MFNAQIWLPVFLQSVHTDLAVPGHVRMKNSGHKVAARRLRGELLAQNTAYSKRAALVRRVARTVNDRLNVGHIFIVEDHFDALQRFVDNAFQLLDDRSYDLRRQILLV